MQTLTTADAIGRYGVEVDDHLSREAAIPVSAGLTRQGDVMVVPARMAGRLSTAAKAVPVPGHPVVRGESGGNTHLLLAAGDVRFDVAERTDETDLALGTLTVADGATAFLAHPEHGYAGIAPGTYQIRRQREQADVIRLVAD
jgi:hypothetical protein